MYFLRNLNCSIDTLVLFNSVNLPSLTIYYWTHYSRVSSDYGKSEGYFDWSQIIFPYECVYRKWHDCKRYRWQLQKPVYQNCLYIAPANSYKISRITYSTTNYHLLIENLRLYLCILNQNHIFFNLFVHYIFNVKSCILYFRLNNNILLK